MSNIKNTIISLSVILLILIILDGNVFVHKTINFLEGLTIQKKDNSVLAFDPLMVNNLPPCPFSGVEGDIYIKNKFCSWSDYKCTLTDTDKCNGYPGYYGEPVLDACWCTPIPTEGISVCAIGTTRAGNSYCYSDRYSTNLYSNPCELCQIK